MGRRNPTLICRCRGFLLLAVWGGGILSGAAALALDLARPEELGLSAARLETVTEYLRAEVREQRIAGAVALIARHGRIGYFEAVGHQDRDAGTPMRTNTLFRAASMTKAITSAAVVMLAEEGSIRFSDAVSKYLPEFESPRVIGSSAGAGAGPSPAAREITIHDLLTHTSGITYGSSGPQELNELYGASRLKNLFQPTDETLRDQIARLAKLPLKFEPGTAWDYSLSIDVLGRVVEVVSGLTLEQFFHERIFRPLRMRDTHFFVPQEKMERLAALYAGGPGLPLRRVDAIPVTAGGMTFSGDYCYAGGRKFFAGGAGLVSTALDYARFLQMVLNGGELGGVHVLNSGSAGLMTRNMIGGFRVPFPGHGDGFGYGFGVLTERGKASDAASVGTFSWGGVFHTYYWADPQEELIGILMTQVYPFAHLKTRHEFKRLAYEALDDSGFSRWYWYEKGLEHGNPFFNARQLRVNAPETSIHPTFATRSEPRSSGSANILLEEDLRGIQRAELYCEVWGGHPGTSNKRVSVNGRSAFAIPEVGTAQGHCTHQYPRFNLRSIDLVSGYNAVQFSCEKGNTFWGHYIIDNACLRIGLPRSDAKIAEAGLAEFQAAPLATYSSETESFRLRLDARAADLERIESVTYQGRYYGYDENGNGWQTDWHGMTKDREPYAMLGSSTHSPFEVSWDVRMLPAQTDVALRAFIRLKGRTNLVYSTPKVSGLEIPERPRAKVDLRYAKDLPDHFWSRDNRRKECHIDLDLDPSQIETAELHVVAWTGGAGEVKDYFKLNGRHFPVAEGHDHEVVYSRTRVDPSMLVRGANRIELLSDTKHHGIEILLPGPALVVRSKR